MKTTLNKYIKHLLYFFLLVFTFSCSKKNDTTPSNPSIVGKWSLVSETLDNIPTDKCVIGSTVTFNLNKTYSVFENCDQTTSTGTYIINGNTCITTYLSSGQSVSVSTFFTVTETALTITETQIKNSQNATQVYAYVYKRVI
jgi:hypothetical protein